MLDFLYTLSIIAVCIAYYKDKISFGLYACILLWLTIVYILLTPNAVLSI